MAHWIRYHAKLKGTKALGDPTVRPTPRLWLFRILAMLWWRKAAILTVSGTINTDGYRIGFIAEDGTAELMAEPLHVRTFAVMVGREDCTFFAVDVKNTTQMALTLEDYHYRRSRRDPVLWRGEQIPIY